MLAAILVLPVALNATVLWFTGFALQGRHVTALLVLAPILAGVLLDARGRGPSRPVRAGIAVAWAASQLAYWLYDVHRHVVGVAGSWSILGREPAWLPGPVLVWALVAALGAASAGLGLGRGEVRGV